MSRGAVHRYAAWCAMAVVAAAVALAPLAAGRSAAVVAWALGGWALMAGLGVAGGAWVLTGHGTPGTRFLLALAVCMTIRLVVVPAGVAAAATATGATAVWAYLVGLAAGYLPAQATEVYWLVRHARRA